VPPAPMNHRESFCSPIASTRESIPYSPSAYLKVTQPSTQCAAAAVLPTPTAHGSEVASALGE
jgi:hypothetical protein